MRITVKHLEAIVGRINRVVAGFDEPDELAYNTIGAYHLYRDQCGYALHRVMNEAGGVENVSGPGYTGRELQSFMFGFLEGAYRAKR